MCSTMQTPKKKRYISGIRKPPSSVLKKVNSSDNEEASAMCKT
jgi:hypothetical protein